ncbi:MAG: FAD-binding oxidoreductase [Betaproteobacteria bacterium]
MSTVENRRKIAVAVLGAGIVGSAAALALAEAGYAVTLFDRDAAGAGTSSGNAGGIVEGAVLPTATPDVIRALPSYLFDRHGAAVLRPGYLFQALPWLMRFIAAGRPSRVAEIAAALHPLVANSMHAHRSLTRLCQCEDRIQSIGWLKVYASDSDYAKTRLQRELMTRHGVSFTELNADEIHDLEPKLNRQAYTRGLFQPGSGFVNHPRGLVEAYFRGALQRQASFVQENVLEIAAVVGTDSVSVRTDTVTRSFDKVVIAAGAWSRQFAEQIGDKVCLDTERGYHISLKATGGPLLTRPVGFPARDCVISPMHDGITVCSGDELAGLRAAPDFRRIRSLLPFVRSVLPENGVSAVQREWMGYRPSTPDSLPVIGPSAHNKNVIYAFGHGHLGLTLSAVTAELVEAIIKGDTAPFDLTPYRINRF